MAIQSGSPYEIPASDNVEPDFTYQSDDKDQDTYVLMFLVGLSTLFTKYEGKSPDFILSHADKDIKKLRTDLTGNVTELQTLFDETTKKYLTDAGILEENLPRVTLPDDIRYGILEQKQTIQGITDELRNNLKSKAYYLKNRGAEQVFSVKSNFDRASKRLKQMSESGFRTTKQKAIRSAQIFLYNDPMAYWVTRMDSRVCPFCRDLQNASPMQLSLLPLWPLHNKCRCDVKLEKDLKLTEQAQLLTHFQIGTLSEFSGTQIIK